MQYKANRLPVTRLRVARRRYSATSDWRSGLVWIGIAALLIIFLLTGCATTLNWTF